MKELYVLSAVYNPATAETNHIMAYVKGIAENGINVSLFFLYPSRNQDKCDLHIENVQFVYLWDNLDCSKKLLKLIVPVKRFYAIMKPGIPVFAMGGINVLYFLRLKRGIKLFHERTENPYKFKNFLSLLYKRVIPKLDGLVVITPSLRRLFIDEFKIKPEKVIVANMVVDDKRFSSLEVKKVSNTIGYCGTISEWKDGVSYLIKAFSIVHQKHSDYKLLLMGNFENEETKDKILSLVEELHLKESVFFTGVVKSTEMPKRLKECEILALSRPRQKEKAFGFATKIGEYLMTERPVVMTDVGDASYYLKDGEEVIFAKPNDEKDFADKLLWVIEHPQQSSRIGINGKLAAVREFNYLNESKKIADFIFGQPQL